MTMQNEAVPTLEDENYDTMTHLEQIMSGWIRKTQFQNDLNWYQRLKEQYE